MENGAWLSNKLFDAIVIAAYYMYLHKKGVASPEECIEEVRAEIKRKISDTQRRQLYNALMVKLRK